MVNLTPTFKIKCNASNNYSSLPTATLGSVLPYISLNNMNGVVTKKLVPDNEDDRCSSIRLPKVFPLGSKSYINAIVCVSIMKFRVLINYILYNPGLH